MMKKINNIRGSKVDKAKVFLLGNQLANAFNGDSEIPVILNFSSKVQSMETTTQILTPFFLLDSNAIASHMSGFFAKRCPT